MVLSKRNKIVLSLVLVLGIGLLLVMQFLTSPAGPYDPSANPQQDIATALANNKEDKLLLLVFGANWCPNCRAFDQQLQSPPLKALVDRHYEVVHVDIGNFDHNMETVERYGKPIAGGIPALAVLNGQGVLIQVVKGHEFAKIRSGAEHLRTFLTSMAQTVRM